MITIDFEIHRHKSHQISSHDAETFPVQILCFAKRSMFLEEDRNECTLPIQK